MRVIAVSARDLTPEHIAAWRQLQSANPSCASPHFSVEFVQAVAAVRDHIEVGIMSQGGEPLGFLPYRRAKGDVGHPIADNFSDLQGCVVPPRACWSADEVIRKCQLNAFHFSNVPATCSVFEPFVWQRREASYIDLSLGFEAYRASRRAAASKQIQETMRKSRKIQREVGPLHFEPCSTDPKVFRTLIDWKRAQLRSRHLGDSFSGPWVIPLLERIVNSQLQNFQGMMSVLRVGDEIIAICLGIKSQDIFHGWITTYNHKFSRYSPGLMLVIHLLQHAESQGVLRLDMGNGDQAFKKSLASGSYSLVGGSIDRRPVARVATQGWQMAKEMIRDTPLETAARAAIRQLRRRYSPIPPAFGEP